MPKHSPIVVPTYPVQRVIRTVLVDVVVWGPTLALMVPTVLDAAQSLQQAGVVPPGVYGHVAALGGVAVTVSGVLARVIALPRVNGLLTRLGAGTVPRAAARAQVVAAVKDTRAALDAISTAKHAAP